MTSYLLIIIAIAFFIIYIQFGKLKEGYNPLPSLRSKVLSFFINFVIVMESNLCYLPFIFV